VARSRSSEKGKDVGGDAPRGRQDRESLSDIVGRLLLKGENKTLARAPERRRHLKSETELHDVGANARNQEGKCRTPKENRRGKGG